jgi:hypothetical protein
VFADEAWNAACVEMRSWAETTRADDVRMTASHRAEVERLIVVTLARRFAAARSIIALARRFAAARGTPT